MKKVCCIYIKEELSGNISRTQDEIVQTMNEKIAQFPSFQFTGFTAGAVGDDFIQNKVSIRLGFIQKDAN